MNQQEYQGLVLLTPSTRGNWLTNDQSYSQRLYVKPNDVAAWREITEAEYQEALPKPPEGMAPPS